MYALIERFMDKLNKEQVNDFAIKNGVILSSEELDFTYEFVIKNWKYLLSSKGNVDISRYKDKYSEENYLKIKKLLKEYSLKYASYL